MRDIDWARIVLPVAKTRRPTPAGVAFGKKLRALRAKLFPKQTDFADALRVRQSLVSDWERGAAIPGRENVARIAATLRMTVDAFLAAMGLDLPSHTSAVQDGAATRHKGGSGDPASVDPRALKELRRTLSTILARVDAIGSTTVELSKLVAQGLRQLDAEDEKVAG